MTQFTFRKSDAPRRTVFAVIAGATVCVLGLAGLIFSAASASSDRADSLRDTVERAAQAAETTSAAPETRFYTGDTPQLGQVALQTELQTLADAHNIALEVIRADEIEQVGKTIQLGLVLNGAVPEGELGPFLAALGNSDKLLIVDELNLRPARATRRNPNNRRIAFQLRLYGYYTS